MEPAQLAMLLDGIDLNAKRLARWKPEGIDTHWACPVSVDRLITQPAPSRA